MNPILEEIKAECRKTLELDEKATPEPWESDGEVVDWLLGASPGVAVRYHVDKSCSSPVCMVQPHLAGRYMAAGSMRPIEDAAFIAHSRTFTPFTAQAMLTMIEWLEHGTGSFWTDEMHDFCNGKLQSICSAWEDRKKQP